ncbi:MAG: outer membrane protein assembly factor BamE [Magnetococcales bacterium]|nr:outer membrane protein assembly factor BamE [Magnetococcales bacterium]
MQPTPKLTRKPTPGATRPTMARLSLLPAVLSLLSGFMLVACQTLVQEQGNILDPQKVAQIREGRTTRKEVQGLLGSPTIVNSFKPNRWIYLQDSRFDKYQAVNRVEIEFDQKGVVRYLARNFGDEVWNPQQLSAAEQERSFRYFRNLVENDVRDVTPNAPFANQRVPLVAGRSVENASRKPGFFERLFSRWKSAPPKPDTSYTPTEAGWWQGIWSSDPSSADRSSAAQSPQSGEADTHLPFPLPK